MYSWIHGQTQMTERIVTETVKYSQVVNEYFFDKQLCVAKSQMVIKC